MVREPSHNLRTPKGVDSMDEGNPPSAPDSESLPVAQPAAPVDSPPPAPPMPEWQGEMQPSAAPVAPPQLVPVMWGFPGSQPFLFDGGAGSYLGVGLLAFLVTVLTLGICLPWAMCMLYRWRSEHTLIYGNRVKFTGSGASLFGHWIKWWLLCIVTIGIYSFWVVPRLTKWTVENQHI